MNKREEKIQHAQQDRIEGLLLNIQALIGGPLFDEESGGKHRHQCPICKTVWEHGDNCREAPRETFEEAHQCPKAGCEGVQRWKYHGNKKARFAAGPVCMKAVAV